MPSLPRSGFLVALSAGLTLMGLGGGGCNADKPTPKKPSKPTVQWSTPVNATVSIAPLKGLIERLLPPGSTVTVLIPPGTSEHGYEIPPASLAGAVKSDLLVWIGGMEPQIDALSSNNPRPGRAEVRIATTLKLSVETCTHDHGSTEAHDHHHGDDPHVWLDPLAAKQIASAAAEGIKSIRLASGTPHPVDTRLAALHKDLEELHADYSKGLDSAPSRTIVVAHDAYGWLARRYALTTVAIAGLNAGEPAPAALQKATQTIKDRSLKAVFTEPQINPAAAQSIARSTGVKVLTLDPLGSGDYFAMMRANLAALRNGMGLETP